MKKLFEKALLAIVSVLVATSAYHATLPNPTVATEKAANASIQGDHNYEKGLSLEEDHLYADPEDGKPNEWDDYVELESAVKQLRDALLEGQEEIEVKIISTLDFNEKDVLCNNLYYPAFSEEYAEDYIFAGNFLDHNAAGACYKLRSIDDCHWDIVFSGVEYAMTPAQLADMECRIKDIVDNLGIRDASDYKKCSEIYKYITSNVRYDYDTFDSYLAGVTTGREPGYTAYAALVDGKAVCAGYAQLFYAMCKYVGLPVRIIDGEGYSLGEWSGHSWNAVRIDGMWYQVDSTWDEGVDQANWEFFLTGSDIPFHRVKEEAWEDIRVSAKDFSD